MFILETDSKTFDLLKDEDESLKEKDDEIAKETTTEEEVTTETKVPAKKATGRKKKADDKPVSTETNAEKGKYS